MGMADGARDTGRGFGFEYRFWLELEDRVCLGMFKKTGGFDINESV
jgi:hypothetical protein